MGSRNNPGEYDCLALALPDEPTFTLLARDAHAPVLIEQWARSRLREIHHGERPVTDIPKAMEALDCAANMRQWRFENDGKWRSPQKTPDVV